MVKRYTDQHEGPLEGTAAPRQLDLRVSQLAQHELDRLAPEGAHNPRRVLVGPFDAQEAHYTVIRGD